MKTSSWFVRGVFAVAAFCVTGCIDRDMPGKSFQGEKSPLSADERAMMERLKKTVQVLSVDIGRRHVGEYENLQRAAAYLEKELAGLGYDVRSQRWTEEGKEVRNLEVTIVGTSHPSEIVMMGAHYDSARTSPAADDNGTGDAAILELARDLKESKPDRTIRLVLFVNEEPPFFGSPRMGSYHYAREAKSRGDDLRAMIALDSIGRFSDAPGSQHYPAIVAGKFPTTGNYIGFVSRNEDAALVRQAIAGFRQHARIPSEGAAAPAMLEGVWYSDHWSFWQQGYAAMMVTDTAFMRWPEYHTPGDTIEHVDFEALARVTAGLGDVMKALAVHSQRATNGK